ncbi:MAG TPA: hypothetical protein VMV07_08210 [Streptosporangiaceae bacterium]|nr:hypothetical protein [Streptosporangiaceae bacterium]
MPLWRIRITLSDDPHSRALLKQALDGQRVTELNFAPRPANAAQMAGDVVLELPRDDDLGTMLSALHRISPQVFVSRVDDDPPAENKPGLTSKFRRLSGRASSEADSMVAAD